MSKHFELLASRNKGTLLPADHLRRRDLPPRFPPVEIREQDWQRAIRALLKHWKLSLGFAVLVFGVVAVWTFLTKPEYEPFARIAVDPPGAETFSMAPATSAIGESQYITTQVQNLQTNTLAIEVVRALKLDQDPEFNGGLKAGTADGSEPNRFTPAEWAALRTLRDRLSVVNQTNTRVIAVGVAARRPDIAANITNTLVDTYLRREFESRHAAIMQSTEWLQRQLDDVRARMEESNRALAEFQRRTGVADLDDTRTTFGDHMTELNRQLTGAQSERIQLQSQLAQKNPESLPQIRENPVVQKITSDLAATRAQLAQTKVTYGDNHPNTQRLTNQVTELESQLAAQKKQIVSQVKTSFAAARAKELLMGGQIRGTNETLGRMAEYNGLKKEALANADVYNQLLRRIKEAGISAASKSSNLRVIDPARVLDRPTRPRRMTNLAAGLAFGLFGGIVLAFLREVVDRRLRTSDDVKVWTGIYGITAVPLTYRTGTRRLLARNTETAAGKFIVERPRSAEAEAIRALQTGILLSRLDAPPRMLLVTSSLPGEGKTTIAANLALQLSQRGRVCLVDADLRRPAVGPLFDLPRDRGLAEVLNGSADWRLIVVSVPDSPGLRVIPAGLACGDLDSDVCGAAMQRVLAELRTEFDFVLVDSPPLLPYADARAISTMVEGVVFVTKSGHTTRDAAVRSLELLATMNSAPIVEIVLNGTTSDTAGYSYYKKTYSGARSA